MGFNLLVGYYALGETLKMRECFSKMLDIKTMDMGVRISEDDQDRDDGDATEEEEGDDEDEMRKVEKESRAIRAGRIVQGVLDRLDASTTRVSLVAFYTEARPVLTATFDKEVVSNVLDGLPMYTAFPSGGTKLIDGVTGAFEVARSWMPETATLLVVSDGDALGKASAPRTPAAIADTIVIGVGDPYRTMPVGGHDSRQDTASLKQLALRLGGTYHQGNEKQVPSALIDELTMVVPRIGDETGLRELALILSVLGASVLALIGPALSLAGRPFAWSRARRASTAGVRHAGGVS